MSEDQIRRIEQSVTDLGQSLGGKISALWGKMDEVKDKISAQHVERTKEIARLETTVSFLEKRTKDVEKLEATVAILKWGLALIITSFMGLAFYYLRA